MTDIYTLGHSRHSAEQFVALLRAADISLLADVRSHPVSKWSPHFAKAALAQLLRAHGIDYDFRGQELGGRSRGAEFYTAEGALDYASRAAAPDFIAGIERLVTLARERRTAILCAEEDPLRCHRRLLVTPVLQRAGLRVVHVRGDGRLEPEALPSPEQLGLFH
jgi:uncharacterized protein (DUF488 family)